MQAQLDRIEKSLAKVQASVDMLADEQHDLEDAKRDALEASFGETYRIAHQTGELTRVQWEALPPVTEAYTLRASTLRALQRERDRLKGLPGGAKDRSEELANIARRLDRVLANLDRDDRLVGQAQVLLLWRMSSTKDPALPADPSGCADPGCCSAAGTRGGSGEYRGPAHRSGCAQNPAEDPDEPSPQVASIRT